MERRTARYKLDYDGEGNREVRNIETEEENEREKQQQKKRKISWEGGRK